MVKLFKLVRLDVVFESFVIFILDKVTVGSIQVDQWCDVVSLSYL